MASEGDNSFEALALPHIEAAYRLARRLSRNEHDAEDLVQEAYLKACKGFSGFEVREFGMRPWLLRILHNTFLNRQSRESKAPIAMDHETLVSMSKPDGKAVSFEPPDLDYDQVDEEVKNAIDSLTPEFRSVLILWATMELSYKEIAAVLSVPVGTVMSRLHRARQHLVLLLGDFARKNRIAISEG